MKQSQSEDENLLRASAQMFDTLKSPAEPNANQPTAMFPRLLSMLHKKLPEIGRPGSRTSLNLSQAVSDYATCILIVGNHLREQIFSKDFNEVDSATVYFMVSLLALSEEGELAKKYAAEQQITHDLREDLSELKAKLQVAENQLLAQKQAQTYVWMT